MQARIHPIFGQQFFVRTDFGNFSSIENDNFIGVSNGTQTVSDNNRGAGSKNRSHCHLDRSLGFVIQTRCRLIKYQHVGIDN